MPDRLVRRLLFVAAALALPWPIVGPWEGLVPAARHVLLFGATAAVAATEGAAGPVAGILLLFGAHALATLALCAALAWAAERALRPLAQRTRRSAVLVLVLASLVTATAVDVYRTPFGRTPTANLYGVLW